MTDEQSETGDTMNDASSAASVRLVAVGLEKTYFTTEPPARVLDGIDLQVGDGEFVIVMGSSGSGKSTLMYCLSGMTLPTAGTVYFDGKDLTGLKPKELSRVRLTEMGIVFQQPHLLENLSIRDNILLPALKATPKDRDAVHARVDALLERFGIAAVSGNGTTEVSGGQAQRAALCRALATEPAVVFADEPTGALGSRMTEEVMDAFTEVHRGGATIVMVTHDPACAARADRVIYLHDGHIASEASLGAWKEDNAKEREDYLIGWLRGLGF